MQVTTSTAPVQTENILNLATRFKIEGLQETYTCELGIKPGNDNRQIAFELLNSVAYAITGKVVKGKLTTDENDNYNYAAGAFTAINVSKSLAKEVRAGRIKLHNIVELPLEQYMSFPKCTALLEEKEAALALLPKQIAELKRVMGILKVRKQTTPAKDTTVVYKQRAIEAENALTAERIRREEAEQQLNDLRNMLQIQISEMPSLVGIKGIRPQKEATLAPFAQTAK